MMKKLKAVKAEMMFSIAQFILKEHKNPVLKSMSNMAAKANLARYGRKPLDFLQEAPGKDTEF